MAISQTSVSQVIERILPHLHDHQKRTSSHNKPFVVALSGLQGCGKSTWAEALTNGLKEQHGFNVINVSLDDFYRRHVDLVRLRHENEDNLLLQTRGQPGTHDEVLATEFFASLSLEQGVYIPSFDKSKFNGEGDRVPRTEWRYVGQDSQIDVVIFEGWCVGFEALSRQQVSEKWQRVKTNPCLHLTPAETGYPTETLQEYKLDYLQLINANLKAYNDTFMSRRNFNFFVHLDTDHLENVYRWRIDQEHALLRERGSGMTDQSVIAFVKGYMPAYELYLEELRETGFVWEEGARIRVILGQERQVLGISSVYPLHAP